MSAIVEDIGAAFEGIIKNAFTVLGIVMGVAVLALALPYITTLAKSVVTFTTGMKLPAPPKLE